jgi:hypothetical protein
MIFLAGLFLGAAGGYLLCGWCTAGKVADMERLCASAYEAMQHRPDDPDPLESYGVPRFRSIEQQTVDQLIEETGGRA